MMVPDNNFARERLTNEISNDRQKRMLEKARVSRIRRELRETRKAEKQARDEANGTSSGLNVLWVVALVVVALAIAVLVFALVHGV